MYYRVEDHDTRLRNLQRRSSISRAQARLCKALCVVSWSGYVCILCGGIRCSAREGLSVGLSISPVLWVGCRCCIMVCCVSVGLPGFRGDRGRGRVDYGVLVGFIYLSIVHTLAYMCQIRISDVYVFQGA